MLNFGNKEFRNLQEQVGKNKEDIESLKQAGMGHDPVPGPQGETGPQGPQGPQGRNPKLVVGYGPLPTGDDWLENDIYIIRGNTYPTLKEGDLYKLDAFGVWKLQFNLIGPQGLPGIPLQNVVINGVGDVPTESVRTIKVDGIVYSIPNELSEDEKTFIEELLTEYTDATGLINAIDNKADADQVVTLSNSQTILGDKTFSGTPTLNNNVSLQAKQTNNTPKDLIKMSSNNNVKVGSLDNELFLCCATYVAGNTNATYDLGSSTYKWKDLYLSGYLRDGTYSIAIGDIASKNDVLVKNQSIVIVGDSDTPLTLKSNITEYSGISFKNSNNDDLGFLGAGYNLDNELALFYDDGNSTREIAFKDWEDIASITLSNAWLNGLTSQNLYGKIVRDRNMLYIVISGRLYNSTGSSITTYYPGQIVGNITIPSSVASKIYRKDGTTINNNPQNGDDITAASIKISNSTSGGIESRICNIYSGTSNNLSIWASSNTGGITVPAGGNMDFDMRIFLIL